MNVQRVLIPTDLSENSNKALESVDSLIKLFDCTVDIMHVIPLSRYLNDSFDRLGIPLNMEKEVYPKLIENKRKELNDFAASIIPEKNRGDAIISIDRKPSDSILEQASKKGYDLILMSSKGGHENEFFHGSATDKIIRRSKIPVLTLVNRVDASSIKKIAVPCDFSNTSLAAIPFAFELARLLGAQIQLLHVIELYAADIQGIEPTITGVDDKAVYEGIKERLQSYFDKHSGANYSLVAKDEVYQDSIVREEAGKSESVDLTTVISKGVSAHHEIIEHANENADMLVMSTHGRSGFTRMLLGSTTEQVIQHIKKPQVTIRPKLKDE